MSKIGSFAPSREEAIAIATGIGMAPEEAALALELIERGGKVVLIVPATGNPADKGSISRVLSAIEDAGLSEHLFKVEGDEGFEVIEPRHYTPDSVYRYDGDTLAFVEVELSHEPASATELDYVAEALYRFDGESSTFLPVPEAPPKEPPSDPVLVEAARSDLFFNYEKTAYESLMRKKRGGKGKEDDKPAPSDEEVHAALLKDAVEFTDTLRNATGLELDREALVADFLKRL